VNAGAEQPVKEATVNDDSITPQDSHYSFEDDPVAQEMGADQFIVEKIFGFCGCAQPWLALEHVLAVLRAVKERADYLTEHIKYTDEQWNEAEARWIAAAGDEKSFLFTLYWLDAKGFTDHGGNVRGSWPTEEGETLLDDLEQWNKDRWPFKKAE
jgi:hypothetical protein